MWVGVSIYEMKEGLADQAVQVTTVEGVPDLSWKNHLRVAEGQKEHPAAEPRDAALAGWNCTG